MRRSFHILLFAAALSAHIALRGWALASLPSQAGEGLISLGLRFNHGVAFSFLRSAPGAAQLMSVAAFFILAAMHRALAALRGSAAWPLLYAGAAGNMADRLTYGYVVDWLQVGPLAINAADMLLCLGGAIFIIDLLRK